MPSLDDIKVDKPTTTLLKGPNGFGKTIAAASYPSPVYIADFDSRVDPLGTFYRGERRKEIYYDSYGIHNLFSFLDLLDELLKTGTMHIDGSPIRPGTVVVDSCTSLSITAVNYQMTERRRIYKTKKEKDQKISKGGILLPDWDEWNGETMIFTQALDVCKAIPERWGIHLIWTAHPIAGTRVSRDSEGKVAVSTKVSPIVAMGNKPANLIPGYFNEIYHFGLLSPMNVGEKAKRIVFTQTLGDDLAKTAKLLPPSFEWTDMLFYDRLTELAKEGMENGGVWTLQDAVSASAGW